MKKTKVRIIHKTAPPITAIAIATLSANCQPKSESPEIVISTAAAVTNVDAITASQLLTKDASMVVLAVRTPQEFAEGHLPGKVVNVDFKAANFKTAAAELDRDTAYLVHCKGGGRSTSSLEVLKELGFTKIYHLDGGISAWMASGEIVEK